MKRKLMTRLGSLCERYWRWRLRHGPRFTPEGQERIVRRLLYGRW